ncbi:hypothetical protein AB0M28_30805 [Streptomyces sp. NPDC051940]|uniref:hypothetical protein n=1 Tax=Streptomyces sp. NPDC051940 TaxID=3155675 RepID=UPI003417FBE7
MLHQHLAQARHSDRLHRAEQRRLVREAERAERAAARAEIARGSRDVYVRAA